jgi:hypothetical protein
MRARYSPVVISYRYPQKSVSQSFVFVLALKEESRKEGSPYGV